MLLLLVLLIGCFVIFPLYCCLAVSTKHDHDLEDDQQLEFIEEWNNPTQS